MTDLPPDGPHHVLGGRVTLWQPAKGYRTSTDAVLLAAAVRATAGQRLLDLGAGVGAVGLCIAARIDGVAVEGLELQPGLVELAARNAALTGVAGRVQFHSGDVSAPPATLAAGGFDHVVMNPPYAEAGEGRPPEAEQRRISFVAGNDAPLPVWIACARWMLKDRGRLVLIHRADRTDRIIAGLVPHFGAIEILPLWPRAGEAAKRVIIRARKGVATPATLHPGLVLHAPDGGWTPEAEAILAEAQAV